jgi:hypothetical protein
MSQHRFTEVTTQSWGGRIKNALSGTLFGLILFLVAFPMLFWNEGRAVQRAKALEEGAGAVVSVAAEQIDPRNQGRLIHLSGTPGTEEVLRDPLFGVQEKAIKLRRNVEMFQWQEHTQTETKEKLGGGTETTTTYTYSKGWSNQLIANTSFKHPEGHRNPATFPYEQAEFTAGQVSLGAFQLSDSLKRQLSNYRPVTPTAETLAQVKKAQPRPAIIQGNEVFIGMIPSDPQVGDLRIRFEVVHPEPISLVSQQQGSSFTPFMTQVGDSIELLEYGTKSAEAMFKSAQEQNVLLTWILRGVGFFLMYAGLRSLLGVLPVLAAVVPALGHLVGFGASLVAGLVAGALSLITVAIAWLFYRPLIGVALLVAGVALLFGFKFAKKEPVPMAPVERQG